MNCKKCGAPLVPGQIICSNCGTNNEDFNKNEQPVNEAFYQNSNQIQNTYNGNINYSEDTSNFQNNIYNQNIRLNEHETNNYQSSNFDNENNTQSDTNVKKKQNLCLKIASIFSLIAGVGMLISIGGNLFIIIRLGQFNPMYLLGILISIIFIFYAFFISNFNLGKNKLYDNKVLFIILLLINLLVAFLYRIYLIVFIFSLIGYIISIKKKDI